MVHAERFRQRLALNVDSPDSNQIRAERFRQHLATQEQEHTDTLAPTFLERYHTWVKTQRPASQPLLASTMGTAPTDGSAAGDDCDVHDTVDAVVDQQSGSEASISDTVVTEVAGRGLGSATRGSKHNGLRPVPGQAETLQGFDLHEMFINPSSKDHVVKKTLRIGAYCGGGVEGVARQHSQHS